MLCIVSLLPCSLLCSAFCSRQRMHLLACYQPAAAHTLRQRLHLQAFYQSAAAHPLRSLRHRKHAIKVLLYCLQELMVPCQSLKPKAQCPLITPIMAPMPMAPCLITPTMAMALCPHMGQGLMPTAPCPHTPTMGLGQGPMPMGLCLLTSLTHTTDQVMIKWQMSWL